VPACAGRRHAAERQVVRGRAGVAVVQRPAGGTHLHAFTQFLLVGGATGRGQAQGQLQVAFARGAVLQRVGTLGRHHVRQRAQVVPWGTFSPAAQCFFLTSADSAALRERMKRPASMWVRASSIALCMARSFCCTRHRRAWWGNSSRAASARSAAYTVTKLVTSSSTTMFREKSMR
jgi:hypothetical protein